VVVPGAAYAKRGFWTSNASIDHDELLWMARNRFNLIGVDGVNVSLARKLGFSLWGGGHRVLSSIVYAEREVEGRTLFEVHPEWFGRVRGQPQPISKGAASYTNPCFTDDGLIAFFSDYLIESLREGDLQEVDVLNLWPSDSISKGSFGECDSDGARPRTN